jgi:hypothetical protein
VALFGRGRAEPRLDPVRWARPGNGTLIRLAAVAVLLGAGATVAWSRTPGCVPPDHPRASTTVRTTAAGSPGDGLAPAGSPTADAGPAGAGPIGDRSAAPRPVLPAGTVGVPVRLAEPAALALVRAGDRVDLLSVDTAGGQATPVAEAAVVLAVSGTEDPTAGGLLLALRPAEARRAVGAAERTRFAVLIRPGG